MRFFMIDRITRWEVGRVAEAIKNVALSEDFFDDHFPRRPILPGVLMIEGMAQLSGLLLEFSLKEKLGKNAKAILTVVERAKFRKPVRPGDTLTCRRELISVIENGGKVSAQALCDGQQVASTTLVFAFRYVNDPMLDEKRNALMNVWMPAEVSP